MGHKLTPISSNFQAYNKAIGDVYLIYNFQGQHISPLSSAKPCKSVKTWKPNKNNTWSS